MATVQRLAHIEDESNDPQLSRSSENRQSLSEYNLEWLFDPDRMDHLPIEEQLKLYAQRDLKKTKCFKVAAQIFGGPVSRTRRIIAPPMRKSSVCSLPVEVHSPAMTSKLGHKLPPISEQPTKAQEKEKVNSYKLWVQERKSLRNNLESMGLSESWLANKPDKSSLEMTMEKRMQAAKNMKTDSSTSLARSSPTVPPTKPVLRRPCPEAIKIIEKFLKEEKLRLMDLFVAFDKNKDWKISKDEFRYAIRQANIPISDVLLEDLILTQETDGNNKLDYRELAMCMHAWQKEKRENKRRMIANITDSPMKYAQVLGFTPPHEDEAGDVIRKEEHRKTSASQSRPQEEIHAHEDTEDEARSKSRTSHKSGRSSHSSGAQTLERPESDLSEERLMFSPETMVDLRKEDRKRLATYKTQKSPLEQSIVKTGDREMDDNCFPSTLGGKMADKVNEFRRHKLAEYMTISELRETEDVPLSEKVLKKALLYHPDRISKHPMGSICQQAKQPVIPPGSGWRRPLNQATYKAKSK